MIFRKGEQLTARKLNEIQPDTLDRIRAGKGVRIQRDMSGLTISADERFRAGFGFGEAGSLKVVQIKSTAASIYNKLMQCKDVETGADLLVLRPLEIMRRAGEATYVRGSAETQFVRWSAGASMDRRTQTWKDASGATRTEKQVVVPPYYTGEYLTVMFCIFPRAVLTEFGVEVPVTDTHAGYWTDINTMGRSWAREDGQYL